tara:strand:+ start:4750 stop:4917 length:168 start_codon:yes stop_codon:yes gene_type:complete
MKIRVKELSKVLNKDTADVIAVGVILNIPVGSPLSSLSLEEAKKITDYFEKAQNV